MPGTPKGVPKLNLGAFADLPAQSRAPQSSEKSAESLQHSPDSRPDQSWLEGLAASTRWWTDAGNSSRNSAAQRPSSAMLVDARERKTWEVQRLSLMTEIQSLQENLDLTEAKLKAVIEENEKMRQSLQKQGGAQPSALEKMDVEESFATGEPGSQESTNQLQQNDETLDLKRELDARL